MFHHVCLSGMIATNEKINFSFNVQYGDWCTIGPGFNENCFQNLHGPLFNELFVTAREYGNDLMCGFYAYGQLKLKSTGATYFYGDRPLPSDSNEIPLISLRFTITFIDAWINILYRNIAWRCLAYQDNTKEIL